MISGVVVLAVVIVIVVTNGGNDGSGSRDAASAAGGARAETLVIGWMWPTRGKVGNPYLQGSDGLVPNGLNQLVFEPLFYFNLQTGEREPWLATGFEHSADHRTITLQLRDDVSWSDGEPFSADDVVFTFERLLAAKAPYRAPNIPLKVESVRKLSATRVRIRLNAPDPRFVDAELAASNYQANFIPVPRHIFRGRRFDAFEFYDPERGWPLGTGPYTLSDVGPSSVTLTRDEHWWAAEAGVADLPAPRRVVYTDPGAEDSTVSGLVTNRLDYAGELVPSVAGFLAARKRNPRLVNWDDELGWLDPCPFGLTINTTRAPWNDADMRWALNAALDKQQFSRVFNTPGEPTPARTTYPEYPRLTELLDANQDLLDRYPILEHDDARAEQTFRSKGYAEQHGIWTKDGEPLTLRLSVFNSAAAQGPAWRTAAQLLEQQLSDAGIKVELVPGDYNVIASARAAGDFDAQTWFECGSVTDPWQTLNRYTNAPGNDNAGGWSNREYERIVAEMGMLPPGHPRIEPLFRRAMAILLRELPVIPLNQRPTPVVMNHTYWTNWPTADNAYTQPLPSWMNFHQVITQLKPAG